MPSVSVMLSYAEGLVTLDEDNNWVPCLAEDWRWLDDCTIEFKLRTGVTFHNGEKFNAESVKINWQEYRKMENPRPYRFKGYVIPDNAIFEIVDEHTVRFTLPGSDSLALAKFMLFFQIAPTFFKTHKFDEDNYGYLSEAGPWGTGPFRFVEGSLRYGTSTDRTVLEANEIYWDLRYPKVQKVIFNNTLIGNRKEPVRLCGSTEGAVDIVSFIRPIDTEKIVESRYAKVMKGRDRRALTGWFNQRKKDSKWRDIRLRKAINYAIDREELFKYGTRGNTHNLGGVIPPGVYGYDRNSTLYSYDTSKARSFLKEAGYPDGFETKIIAMETWSLEAQIISKMLERVGLGVSLRILADPEWFRKTHFQAFDIPSEEQDWDIALWCPDDVLGQRGTSFLLWYLLEECDTRWIEYDPICKEMFKAMIRTGDRGEKKEKVREMVKYILEKNYDIFVYSPMILYALNKEVELAPWMRSHLRLLDVSVTDNHWSMRDKAK
jgi:peptide/nickel transport system substrate-binding protein